MTTNSQIPQHPAESPAEPVMSVELWRRQRRAFTAHAAVFASGMVAIFVVNLAAGIAGDWSAWWSVWALLGWSIGVAVHGFVVWLNRPGVAGGAS